MVSILPWIAMEMQEEGADLPRILDFSSGQQWADFRHLLLGVAFGELLGRPAKQRQKQ